jgi:cycloeucalenol cycloisomerase
MRTPSRFCPAYLLLPLLLQFPYYTFVDRSKMYSVGSLFYAIYFFVSFPMFMRIDEDPSAPRWILGQVRRDDELAICFETWALG